MNEKQLMQETEISLFDALAKIKNGWLSIAGCICLGVAGAGLVIMEAQPKYEAVAVIRVGMVAGQPVEPAVFSVERFKLPAFQQKIAASLEDGEWHRNILAAGGGNSGVINVQLLKATAAQPAGLIEIRAVGHNPDYARQRVEGAIAELVRSHDGLASPVIKKMRDDLDLLRDKLVRAEKEWAELTRQISGVTIKDERFTQLSLISSLRLKKEEETFSLRQSVMAIEASLAPPATQSAKAVESVFVSDKPVSPKKSLILALGLVGGLLAGVMSIFVLDAWRKAKQSRK